MKRSFSRNNVEQNTNQYSNPNQIRYYSQKPNFKQQQQGDSQNGYGLINQNKLPSHSNYNQKNVHKIPQIILNQIAQNTRIQHQNRIKYEQNQSENKQKKLKKQKSNKTLFNRKYKKQNLLSQDNSSNESSPQQNAENPNSIKSSNYKQICKICLIEQNRQQFVSIDNNSCCHIFCRSCMHQYVIFNIKMFQKVICPEQNCNVQMKQTSKIYFQLPLDTRQKFKKIMRQNQVLQSKNKRLCPNQNCNGILNIQNQQINPRCAQCNIVYCKKCYFKNHAGQCDAYQLQFFRSTLNYRQCAKCQCLIQKNDGCNHMTCRCGYQFCYLCGNKWRRGHFCQKLAQSPRVENWYTCGCFDCQRCEICDTLDYICQCYCLDDWQICQIKPIRWISKLFIIILVTILGLPLWVIFMVVYWGLQILLGIIIGLIQVPYEKICWQNGNCKWIILGLILLPLTIPLLMLYGIYCVFKQQDFIFHLSMPYQAVKQIVQI